MYSDEKYQDSFNTVRSRIEPVAQSTLITKTYVNLSLAVLAFAAIEAAVFMFAGVNNIAAYVSANSRMVSFVLLGLCIGGPFLANMMLGSNPSRFGQYCLLGFYVLLYAAIFLPILTFAMIMTGDGSLIFKACGLTASIFTALSAAVFFTRKDFSFLRGFLVFAGIAALILIVASLIFQFSLGVWFSVAMIVLACGYILYDTSNVIHRVGEGGDVLAAIALFGSLMTLFFYILRLVMETQRR